MNLCKLIKMIHHLGMRECFGLDAIDYSKNISAILPNPRQAYKKKNETSFHERSITARFPALPDVLPFVAYGLAAAVGFSLLSLSAHYPSVVFIGAVLGYSVSRFAVFR
jgi:hypothetical protein